MRRSTDETTTVQQPSLVASTTRQNRTWLCFVSFFYCLSVYLASNFNHVYKYSNSNCRFIHSLSTGRYHRRTGISHMRSAQSARIASTTVALFNRFNTISSFRLFSVNSVVSKGEAFAPVGRAPNRSSPLQTSQTAFKSFSLLSYQSIDRNLLVRRHLSTSGEIEDKNQKSSSFSVPAMGTGIDNDGSIATNDYTGYEKWVRRLYATNMFHPVKLGLENMHLLHKLLGNPMDDVSTN
jgi:hypothetical protein